VAVSRAGPIIFDICVRLVPVIPAVIPDPALSPSDAAGVGHPAKFACLGNWSNRSEPSSLGLMSAPLSFQSLVVVVTQPAK
jgi:hypothetical protein